MTNKTKWSMPHTRARVWCSYLCIGFLSLLCGIVIFGVSNRIILKQTRDAFSDVLKASGSMLDGKIKLIQNAASEIAASEDVVAALGAIELRPANRQAMINLRVYEELADYCARIDGLSSVSIFRMSDEKVLASECCAQSNIYFDMRYRGSLGLDYAQWKAMMKSQYTGLYEQTLHQPDGRKTVWYMRSLPLAGWNADARSQATLVLEIDESFFVLYYNELGLENDLGMEIINQSGAHFWGAGESPRDTSVMTALTMISDKTGWSYRLYVPNHLMTRPMRTLIWVSLIVFIALEIANFLLIPRFVDKYYGPVSRMVSNISQKLGVKINDTDLAFVQTQFDHLIREQSHTLATVETLKNSMRQVRLINLLLDSGNSDNLRGFEINDFDCKAFMVGVVAGRGNTTLGEEAVHTLSRNIIGEDGFLDGECVRFNGCAVFLIECASMNEEDREINIDIMRERLDDALYLFAVSRIYVGVNEIAVAYREAKWHAQYAALSCGQRNANNETRVPDEQSLADSARLINRIADRDTYAARESIAALFAHNRAQCLGDPALSHMLTSVLISDLLKNCGRCFPGWESELVDTWNRCLSITDYERLERTLTELAVRLCQRPQNEESPREALKREILSYIKRNYSDYNLGIDSIAEAFGKSAATITRAFRENGANSTITGEIAKQRVAAACKLLSAESDMTIAAVSIEAGYTSMATFMRHFKQLTGVAPGRYRELSKKQ